MEAVIKVNDISHSFGKETVLKDIQLSVGKGEVFGLLGPSGSGKTTLVKIIVGILKPISGNAVVLEKTMPSLKQMKHIGFMAQSDALYSELSGRENLDFFASVYGLSKAERQQRIREVLEVLGLSDDIDKPVDKFSGGMKRRVSLAAALLHKPEILILDEPTVGIDPVLRKSIWEELNALKDEGTTIILTTHVMDEAEKCDQLALLRNGHVIAQGTPHSLKKDINAATIEEAFLHYGGVGQ
ncbi:ABC transporter ATP-binding protein [Thalassobacillus devorans]|uniref:ABC transporter ATP-binding protein n=1 Tax=Thalassobacillus devorans TaxID=279813 RepID=A0ABQ1PVI4_9BACI|nr:ABC transporter ATP-binding protein [Thalassobacillus devorans]NIK30848.1 ABC-2 type transport system ATP-binding protein [Thalassobacillus devorans]GGD04747.1 ABC transporter ATP-binding protein [Thalassobacillus devorans]